jgi:hypothetical protein
MNNVRPIRFVPNPQRQADIDTITAWMLPLPDGQRTSWLEIEQQTGVKMDDRGRKLVRHVARKLNRVYRAIPGYGFELSSAGNALDIAHVRNVRVRNEVDRASSTITNLLSRHGEQMTQDARNRLLQCDSFYRTLQLSASLAKPVPVLKK